MKPKLSNETFLSPAHRGNLNIELERRSQTAAKRKRLQIQHFRYHRKLSTAGREAAKFILSLGQEWAGGKQANKNSLVKCIIQLRSVEARSTFELDGLSS